MASKKISKSSIIGQQGVNVIEEAVLGMGFLWYPSGGIEAGIDGVIEVRDSQTGEVYNSIIQVQSKATESKFQAETEHSFEYVCKQRDIAYWLQGNAPVIIVVVRPSTKEAYWVSIKDYFTDSKKIKDRKILFNKNHDKFDVNCKARLLDLAAPLDSGIYLSPPIKSEQLISNLLPITHFSKDIYLANTDFRTPKSFWAELNKLSGSTGGEWVLKDKRILSFNNLNEFPWNQLVDLGTLEWFDSEEWAYSEDDNFRRDFVQLLNMCLKEKLYPQMRYSDRKDCFYFSATKNLSNRKISYSSTKGGVVTRTVFKGYKNKKDPTRIAYYRHSAFEGNFKFYDRNWYLEITPTYYFTRDGIRIDRWYEDRLKTIKQLEKNPAVLGQVMMWQDYLSRPNDMFSKKYPFLEFGKLKKFQVGIGLYDNDWLQTETERERKDIQPGLNELPLFNDES
ncbi:DUF4365 domain-containing protein [bacterium]|nr:DUF4365 domain-containing protein [bacterium]